MGGALINVDVIFERDLAVPMRDGVILSALQASSSHEPQQACDPLRRALPLRARRR
jgi:hypothetical protein